MNLKGLSCILALSPIICVVLGALTLQTFVSLSSSTGNKIHSTELFGGMEDVAFPLPQAMRPQEASYSCVSQEFPRLLPLEGPTHCLVNE